MPALRKLLPMAGVRAPRRRGHHGDRPFSWARGADFIERYTRLRPRRDGLALIDKPNGECVFLDGIDCQIQAVKPHQCAGFPNEWNFPG